MPFLRSPSASQISLGLAALRIITGIILAAHGGQKLFVYGFDGVAGAFAGMGVPLPGVTGPFIALLEFFGGLALIVGFLTRIAALGLASTMLGAILLVHISKGFFNPAGIEFPLSLFAAMLALVFMGAGGFSVDQAITRRRSTVAR